MRRAGRIAASVLNLILAAASVLATGAVAHAATAGDDPGAGALLARIDGALVPMPIASMEADLQIAGPLVRGRVTQTFSNPGDTVLDAVYVFPLPEGAAVDELTLRIGERLFRGRIEETVEARRTFERARSEGKGAGLLEQRRPNVFRTSVANIPPRATVTVALSFLDEADWSSGEFSTVLPMTITPRYAPAGTESGEPASKSDAPPVILTAHIAAGIPLAEIASPSHAIRTSEDGDAFAVTLAEGPAPADRDFVLRWRPEVGTAPVAGGLVEDRPDGRYAMAMLVPPEIDRPGVRGLPTQTVFVVDVSGSMAGPSIEQAKAALVAALDRLGPDDTFTLIRFDSTSEAYSERFLPAEAASVEAAQRWIEGLSAGSGTEILPALLRALDLSEGGDARVARRVVLITDGAVENEEQVLQAVGDRLGGTRLHIVGIGLAPNRWLMRELARVGRGACAFIGSISDVRTRTIELLERTERAIVTEVALEWDGAPPIDAVPDPVPDLYAGRPLVVIARLDSSLPPPRLRVWGRAPGGPVSMEVELHGAREGSGIGTRWARARVAALESARLRGADPAAVRADVIDIAKRFALVTPYTSFVVVADDEDPGEPAQGDDADGAVLPQGGTHERLLLAIGVALASAGGLLLGLALRAKGGSA